MPLPFYLREIVSVTVVEKAEWASGTIWTDTENLSSLALPDFELLTVHFVAKRYTDQAIR
jgi:hypothetical protein